MLDLPTKYRPERLKDVVGQEAVVRSLAKILEANTNHAFIFHGPSGVGKTTLARIVARKLGCLKPNLQQVDGATYSGVDSMRAISAGLHFCGLGDPVRVVVVDEAHAISKQSWQALLKIVEEPPAHAYWCFCTTEPSKIPRTIKTRCVEFRLVSVSVDDLYSLLEKVVEGEGIEISEDILYLIAEKSGGSPRQALNHLSQVAYCKDRKTAASLMQVVEDDNPDVAALCRQLLTGNVAWPKVRKLLLPLTEQSAEGVRIVITNYLSKAILNTKDPGRAARMMEVGQVFRDPYPPCHTLFPLILSIGEVLYAEDD